MKKIFLTVLTIGTVMSSLTFAQGESSDLAQKLELAKEYTEYVSISDEISKSIDEIIVQVPVDKRPILKSALERNIKTDRLNSVSQMALADVFTLAELKALVAFYKTPEGKSIKEKMPQYQERLAPILNEMIRDAVESYDRQVK